MSSYSVQPSILQQNIWLFGGIDDKKTWLQIKLVQDKSSSLHGYFFFDGRGGGGGL